MPDPPKPLVDDRYWFERSKELTDKASTTHAEAAAKLQTSLVWIWGVYTASAAVGLTLAKSKFSPGITFLIALPSLLMPIAYWVTTWVQMPAPMKFDPRSPPEIREAVNKNVNDKVGRLWGAVVSSGLATASVAVALLAAAFSRPVDDYALTVLRCAGGIVSINGKGPESASIAVGVGAQGREPTRAMVVRSDDAGVFAAAVRVSESAKEDIVTASWKGADGLQMLAGKVPDDTSSNCSVQEEDAGGLSGTVGALDLGSVGPFAVGHESSDDPAVSARICAIGQQLARDAARLVSVFVVGSADRQPLHGPLQGQFDSNTGLAQARAQWVVGRLKQGGPGCGPMDAGTAPIVVWTSGPSVTPPLAGLDSGKDYASDRSVHVWALTLAPSALRDGG